MRRALFRLWRWLRGRDYCEMCDGRSGARGNENIIRGIVMCDDCHVRELDNIAARVTNLVDVISSAPEPPKDCPHLSGQEHVQVVCGDCGAVIRKP